MEPADLTLTAAGELVRDRRLSPVELMESVLARAAEVEPHLNAYVTVTAGHARRTARAAEHAAATGTLTGPLHGIPMALKDLIDVAGLATTASSRVRADHVAERDSIVAARLSAAGAALVGKTHTHEFAYGLITPQTRNARDHTRIAGGSSGGSAVAVAAGAATFALGTDTGGSVRVPAALNGVVGLKPTYGLIPRHGVIPLSSSLDHVGILTRTVQDAIPALDALTTHAPQTAAKPARAPLDHRRCEASPFAGLRIGVPRNHFFDHVEPGVETAVRRAIDEFTEHGAHLVDVDIPMARWIQAVQWGLMVPEATAHHEETLRTMPELYSSDVRVLLEAGALMPAADHLRARRARTLMRGAWLRLFDTVDVIAAPTVPLTAVPIGQESVTWPDGTVESVSDACVRLCAPANITGLPALSVPVAHHGRGLPVGMQLIGRPLDEPWLLRLGAAYEQVTGAME